MRSVLRCAGYAAGGLVMVALLLAAYIWIASNRAIHARLEAKPENLSGATPAMLADGARQLKIAGCISCHGEGLRGKLFFDIPNVAKLYAPNITEVAAKASDQQLAQAIRQGVGYDGRPLFVMPASEYSRLTDGEVAALIHAIRALPHVPGQTPSLAIGPLGRIGLLTGKFSTQPDLVAAYAQDLPTDAGPSFAAGRHIAMTVCADCHGPSLKGGEPDGIKAPDLAIAAAYDLAAFKRLMRTGVPASGRDLKLMDDIARNDLHHFNDREIAALHAYLVARAERAR